MNKRRADNGIPKYQQIATDIAYKIVNGIYQGFFGDSAQSNVHSCGLGCGDD